MIYVMSQDSGESRIGMSPCWRLRHTLGTPKRNVINPASQTTVRQKPTAAGAAQEGVKEYERITLIGRTLRAGSHPGFMMF